MACIRQRGMKWQAMVCTPGKRVCKTFATKGQADAWAAGMERRPGTIQGARMALSDHRLACVIPKRFKQAVMKANYTGDELVNASFPVGEMVGVYFLIRDFEVVYVGKSINFLARILKHVRNGRRFESFSFIPCERDQLDELERTYIDLLMPKLNQLTMCPDLESEE